LPDGHGRTPLTYAVWSGNASVVELLVKAGAQATSADKVGGTPLSYAVCSGREEIVELLVNKKSQVDSVDGIIRDLLCSAALSGDKAVVELLLKTGRVDVNAGNRFGLGLPPIRCAVQGNNADIVRILLGTGQVDVYTTCLTYQLLDLAAERNNIAVVSMLLDTGEMTDNSKSMGLITAVLMQHWEIANLIVNADGANLETVDASTRRTPLLHAVYYGQVELARALLLKGARINRGDWQAQTPLHLAVVLPRTDMVRLLLDFGADPTIKDKEGRRPIDLARDEVFYNLLLLKTLNGNRHGLEMMSM